MTDIEKAEWDEMLARATALRKEYKSLMTPKGDFTRESLAVFDKFQFVMDCINDYPILLEARRLRDRAMSELAVTLGLKAKR